MPRLKVHGGPLLLDRDLPLVRKVVGLHVIQPGASELDGRLDLLRRDAAAEAVGDDLHLVRHAVDLGSYLR